MIDYRDPARYWDKRLKRHFGLQGVGHGSLGPGYNRRMYRARREGLDRALGKVGRSLSGARVIDVGCGSGYYTEYCSVVGASAYLGLDIAPTSVATLRGLFPGFRFEVADVTIPELGRFSGFDFVLAADVLFHIVEDDKFETALANLASWLEVNGLFVASDVLPESTVQPAAHVRHRSLAEYEACLMACGLAILHVEPIFAVLHPPTAVPGLHPLWSLYASIWRWGWRIARMGPADLLLPRVLGWLDRAYLVQGIGVAAPTPKWLVALKTHAP